MTHAQLLKQLKPYVSIVFNGSKPHYSVIFFYNYGREEINVTSQSSGNTIDQIKAPRFATLIAIRSLVAKWLKDKGYSE